MKASPNEILVQILRILQKAGFSVSQVDSEDYCFEIVAKKDNVKLLIKTSENIDNARKEPAEDLRSLAVAYSATPLIIGRMTHNGTVEKDTLYERHGVNVISPSTFKEIALSGKLPFVYSKRGGLYFRINGKYLRKLREERGMSLGDLAKRIGVSRKAIYDYETGSMGATFETVAKIEETMDSAVTAGINVFDWHSGEDLPNRSPTGPVARQLHGKLREMGCKTIGFTYAPVDVHARNMGISFISNDKSHEEEALDRKVRTAVELGKLLQVESVLVTGDHQPRDLNITVIHMDDMKKLESIRDLEQLLNLKSSS
jgi:putative transcriptional regulator